MLVIVAATLVQLAIVPEGQELHAGLGVLVAIYTIGERLDRPTSLGLTPLTGNRSPASSSWLGQASRTCLPSLIQTELILGVAWLLGDGSRVRHLYTETLEERARAVEREREERT